MKKLISIIMPVKNGVNYIAEAIEGIKKQNMNIEIIVVDDASTDNTADIAQSMGCKVIKHEINKGQVVAKNTALKIAKGEYIMFHDHDDVMNTGVLLKMYNELTADPTVSAVMCKLKDFISPDAVENNSVAIKPEAYYGLFAGAVLMKKDIFDKIGLFNENITAGEVLELQAKMNEHSIKMKKLDIVSTNRRVHNTNYGKTNQKKEYQDYATIIRAKLKGSKDTMTPIVNTFLSSSFRKDRMNVTDNENQLNVDNLMSNLDKDA